MQEQFCPYCGAKLDDDALFCKNCGETITKNSRETHNSKQEQSLAENPIERKMVYEGYIHKCPNCGEVINSFVSICPICGFELNNKRISPALLDFIKEVNECERTIASSPQAGKTGWASWSKGKRFWWVILNIFFLCIPLVIYMCCRLFMVKSTPKLTEEEKRMTSLIENFPFPIDRESILSALMFSREKIDFISKETVNRKNAYWMRLWCAKAEQLKHKADMLFPNDPIVRECYDEIAADKARVNKALKFKAIAGVAILIAMIAFLFVIGTSDNSSTANTSTNIPETELSIFVPRIDGDWGETAANNSESFKCVRCCKYGII